MSGSEGPRAREGVAGDTERPSSFTRDYLLLGPIPGRAVPFTEVTFDPLVKPSPIKLIDLAYKAPRKLPEGDYDPGLG